MKLLLFLLILFIIFGCAGEPLTPEERRDALIVETEQFWIAYDNCLANRGTVVFKNILWPIRYRMGRRPQINKWDMRSATCLPHRP